MDPDQNLFSSVKRNYLSQSACLISPVSAEIESSYFELLMLIEQFAWEKLHDIFAN